MDPRLERLLIENAFTGEIPDKELNRIIEEVQKKQEKILSRKYVTEEELRKRVVYTPVKY